jgi:hypothetical protein
MSIRIGVVAVKKTQLDSPLETPYLPRITSIKASNLIKNCGRWWDTEVDVFS